MADWCVRAVDCLEGMASLDDASVDAVVTDPPYGIGFMGKDWDKGVPGVAYWAEALRVAKPGAHLLAFGGTRMVHRLACAIEGAGWVVRDRIHWCYATGFPKSLDVSKAIDRQRHDRGQVLEVTAWVRSARDAAGVTNKQIDDAFGFCGMAGHWTSGASQPSVPTLDQVPTLLRVLGSPEVPERVRRLLVDLNGAKGTPGAAWFEREVVGTRRGLDPSRARLGFAGATYSGEGANAQHEYHETAPSTEAARAWEGWGTALKPAVEPIILARKPLAGTVAANVLEYGTGAVNVDGCRVEWGGEKPTQDEWNRLGSAGAESDHVRQKNAARDAYAAGLIPVPPGRWPANLIHDGSDEVLAALGGSSRVFFCAKPSAAERAAGLGGANNTHPTVKPTALMAYLCRLVTQPGGLVLDPFCGSGTTGRGAVREGFGFLGFELDPGFAELARARVAHAAANPEDAPAQTNDPDQLGLFGGDDGTAHKNQEAHG